MPEKLYTTGEVAKIFGVSYVAVKKWAYSGKTTLKRPAVNTGILRARLRGSSARKHQKAGSRFMLE
jgi:transposase